MKELEKAKIDYETHEDYDGVCEGKSKVPTGWKLTFGITVAWMLYYIYAYTPIFSGWTQTQGLQ